MAKLTDGKGGTIAKAAPPESGQRFIFDDHRDSPRGFGLRLTAAGGKAFILKYAVDGVQRRKTIGDWPTWSLEAARDAAKELRQQIDKGRDPLAEDRRRKDEPTVSEVVSLYVESHVSGLASEKAIKRYFERDLVPALGDVRVREVRRRDLIDMIERKAVETPTAARHLLAYTKGLFDWCLDREYIDASPATIRPKSIKRKGAKNALKPVTRARVLDPSEVRSFWRNAQGSGMHMLTAIALKLVLLTGQRPGEVSGMRLSEIEGDVWVIPASRRLKTEEAQSVPLTPLMLELIEEARQEVARLSTRRHSEPSDIVFEARPGKVLGVNSLGRAVGRYTASLGNKDKGEGGHWTPHDLRRTARTGIAACGFPQDIAERVLGHAVGGIVGVYDRHTYDKEKREALEAWGRRLELIIKGKDPDKSNVVAMRAKA